MSSQRRDLERCVIRLVRVFGSDDRIEAAVTTLRLRSCCSAMEFGGVEGSNRNSRRSHRDGNASAAQNSIVATHYPLSLPSNFVAKPFPFAVVRVSLESISVYRASDRAFLCDVKWKHVTTLRRHVSDDGAPHVLVVSLAVVHRDGILVLDLPNADVELGIVSAVYAVICHPSESSSAAMLESYRRAEEGNSKRKSSCSKTKKEQDMKGNVKKSPSPNAVYGDIQNERREKDRVRQQKDSAHQPYHNHNHHHRRHGSDSKGKQAPSSRQPLKGSRSSSRNSSSTSRRNSGSSGSSTSSSVEPRLKSHSPHSRPHTGSRNIPSRSSDRKNKNRRGVDVEDMDYRRSDAAPSTSAAAVNIVRGSSAGPISSSVTTTRQRFDYTYDNNPYTIPSMTTSALPISYPMPSNTDHSPSLPISGDAVLFQRGLGGVGLEREGKSSNAKKRSGSELERIIREREAEMRREIAFNPIAAKTSRNFSLSRLRRSDGSGGTATASSSGSPYSSNVSPQARRRAAAATTTSADKEVTIAMMGGEDGGAGGEDYVVDPIMDDDHHHHPHHPSYRYGAAVTSNTTTTSTLPPASRVIETTFSPPSQSAAAHTHIPTAMAATTSSPNLPTDGMAYEEEDDYRTWMHDRRMDMAESVGLQRRGRRQAASVRAEPMALFRNASPSQQSSPAWKELSPLPSRITSSSLGGGGGGPVGSRSNSASIPQSRSDITAEMQSLLRQLETEEAAANKAFNEQQDRLKAVARDKAVQLASMRQSASSSRQSDTRGSAYAMHKATTEPPASTTAASIPSEQSNTAAVVGVSEGGLGEGRKEAVVPQPQKSAPPIATPAKTTIPPPAPVPVPVPVPVSAPAPPSVQPQPPQPSAKTKAEPTPAVTPSKALDEKPASTNTQATAAAAEEPSSHPKTESKRVTSTTTTTNTAETAEPVSKGKKEEGGEKEVASVASPWQTRTDKKSGRTYYFNPETRETRWKPPQVEEEAAKQTPAGTTSTSAAPKAAEVKKSEKSTTDGKEEEKKVTKDPKAEGTQQKEAPVAAAAPVAPPPAKQPPAPPPSQVPPAPLPAKKALPPPPPAPAKKAQPPPPIQHPEAMAANKEADKPAPAPVPASTPQPTPNTNEDKPTGKPTTTAPAPAAAAAAAAADPSAEEEERNKAENAARRQQAEQKALEDHKQLRVGGLSLAEALARERERTASTTTPGGADGTPAAAKKKDEPAKAAESSAKQETDTKADQKKDSDEGGADGGGGGGSATTAAKQTVGGSIFGSWKELFHKASGRHYYRHVQTNEAVWKVPDEVKQIKEQLAAKAAKLESPSAAPSAKSAAPTPAAAAPAAAPAPAAAASKGDAGGGPLRVSGAWKEIKDPKSGRIYYANSETKQRTWKIAETPFANA